jgi:hypothetical protein
VIPLNKKSFRCVVLLLFFLLVEKSEGVCTGGSNDTGGDLACTLGIPSTWRYFDGNGWMWATSTCFPPGSVCGGCGAADSTSPCAGCGYQNIRNASNCFSDSNCSTVCTPVPEMPENSSLLFLTVGVFVLGGIFYFRS